MEKSCCGQLLFKGGVYLRTILGATTFWRIRGSNPKSPVKEPAAYTTRLHVPYFLYYKQGILAKDINSECEQFTQKARNRARKSD